MPSAGDFHVDWPLPDGSWRTSPPVPWPWKRFTADEKPAIVAERDAFYQGGNAIAVQREGAPRPRILMKSGPVPDVEPAFAPMSAIPDPR